MQEKVNSAVLWRNESVKKCLKAVKAYRCLMNERNDGSHSVYAYVLMFINMYFFFPQMSQLVGKI